VYVGEVFVGGEAGEVEGGDEGRNRAKGVEVEEVGMASTIIVM
jgi:hypothetical protein